jgi:hypothetical protein
MICFPLVFPVLSGGSLTTLRLAINLPQNYHFGIHPIAIKHCDFAAAISEKDWLHKLLYFGVAKLLIFVMGCC